MSEKINDYLLSVLLFSIIASKTKKSLLCSWNIVFVRVRVIIVYQWYFTVCVIKKFKLLVTFLAFCFGSIFPINLFPSINSYKLLLLLIQNNASYSQFLPWLFVLTIITHSWSPLRHSSSSNTSRQENGISIFSFLHHRKYCTSYIFSIVVQL